ncbi:MAG TPA: hypothetical protein VE954_17280 [Oligoflexus sp.]|uniref:hypothetical protein n=1 Tax=Oligoflexus sp. TaxID=1971216 RepID=UPI002D3D996B|nr:hypothetical protein [Oligoflexus sp.]HYX34853.1 hypothetical protein [Oligoflexus sp.]
MSKPWLKLSCLALPLLVGCDPYHKDKCEWYLVPEPEHIQLVDTGWVSLCARNYTINKERCYLKSTLDFAKELNGKLIRFSSLKVAETGPYPREILSVKTCKPDKE